MSTKIPDDLLLLLLQAGSPFFPLIPDIVVAGKAGGGEEAVRGPDQGPGGDEGDSSSQASGS